MDGTPSDRAAASPPTAPEPLLNAPNPASEPVVRRPARLRSASLTGLFILAVLYTAYFARALFIPIAMAIMLTFVLAPVVRLLTRRLRLPTAMSAAIVVMGLLGAIGLTFSVLSGPAADWMVKLPNEIRQLESRLRPLSGAVQNVQGAAKTVEDMAQSADDAGPGRPVQVVVRGPSLTQLFLGQTMSFSVGLLVTFGLLIFLLAMGDALLRQAVAIAPSLHGKRRVVEIARETEGEISHYLASITVINIGVGVAVGLAMWALGLPNPSLWGVMAFLLNFVPFVGSTASFVVITLVSANTFDTPLDTSLPPIAYLIIHFAEANFVAPIWISRRLTLNPMAVILSLIFWTWMWGIPGTLLAVPLLAALKIFCEHVESLHGVAVLLTHPNRIGFAEPTA